MPRLICKEMEGMGEFDGRRVGNCGVIKDIVEESRCHDGSACSWREDFDRIEERNTSVGHGKYPILFHALSR